ncbi:MAG: recombination protein RecR [Candidatus Sungbacteria bacterium]|nr:recombination protein RecR [Candidatus Sungbacteria bacterium]
MYPAPIQKLIDLFTKFPGIGPRQATRFVFFMLKNRALIPDLRQGLADLDRKIAFCPLCYRALEQNGEKGAYCMLCRDTKRNSRQIAVVEKEADLQNLEKTGSYSGLYHVLSGLIAPLDPNSPKGLHLKELHERVNNLLEKERKCEIILATGTTTEGDMTALYIERILAPLKNKFPELKISRLGRGLSLGSELEYADEVTLKNALTNRK